MTYCMFDRSAFISKILSIAKLNSPFFCEPIRLTVDSINHSWGEVKAVICCRNRNGQVLFRLFDTEL